MQDQIWHYLAVFAAGGGAAFSMLLSSRRSLGWRNICGTMLYSGFLSVAVCGLWFGAEQGSITSLAWAIVIGLAQLKVGDVLGSLIQSAPFQIDWKHRNDKDS